MKKYFSAIILSAALFSSGCVKEDDFLDKKPTDILLDEAVWKSKKLVLNVLADLYDRIPNFQSIDGYWNYGNFNEGFISRNGDRWRFQNNDWGYGEWGMWDYGYMRDLNIAIQKLGTATELEDVDRNVFLGETRFLRALLYFEMVKRMGGVPLITEPMTYDFSGDPTPLQHPRAKEADLYDFIIAELDAVTALLPDNPGDKTRATKGTAQAYISRVALYAGSIAKYGGTTPSVTLVGGEVGIPASKANTYYNKALTAAKAVQGYSLYLKKPADLADNFANIFLDKGGNPEVIFAEDYKLKSGKVHNYTIDNQPMSMTEESFGSGLNPALNLVQEFELLNNTYAPLNNTNGSDFVYYDNPLDIFAGRDARLAGTVILPGASFRGRPVDIWGGYMLADKSIISGTNFGAQKTLPGKTAPEVVVGEDGPIPGLEWSAQTGFLVRKWLDPNAGAGSLGTASDVWFIRMRYAEVLLNAAEAAFELGLPEAKDHINLVRRRAGFTTDLTAVDITFDRIVHERRIELAFEDHILWDNKRWRLAHKVWNGSAMTEADLKANMGKSDKINTQVFGLTPYKVYTPGVPATNGKWVFKIEKPNAVTGADRFRLGNYYSYIGDDVINNNPKIVRNPNQ
ncbi:MAG: RagB/SusD family nutrient uptake outer membrane protein [Niastella sp.]|nr:RagB/SusD family nutrient uptake outer membrane protein [Niastella sp.]